MNEFELELLKRSYSVLANIHNNWIGRHTAAGQKLLCDLRDTIAEKTGRPIQDVQDEVHLN